MRKRNSKSRATPPGARRKSNDVVQYTVRFVPREVDQSLRQRAKKRGESLNDVLLNALRESAGVSTSSGIHHDLDHLAGSMTADPQLDRALTEMRQIDEDMWR
jgi:hypothetical protein